MNTAKVLEVEEVNKEIKDIRNKLRLTFEDIATINKLREKVQKAIQLKEFIGHKKWMEARAKEGVAEEELKDRLQHSGEQKVKEERKLRELGRKYRDIGTLVQIAGIEGSVPDIWNRHDVLMKICKMVESKHKELENYWLGIFAERAPGRPNEIEDMSEWFKN